MNLSEKENLPQSNFLVCIDEEGVSRFGRSGKQLRLSVFGQNSTYIFIQADEASFYTLHGSDRREEFGTRCQRYNGVKGHVGVFRSATGFAGALLENGYTLINATLMGEFGGEYLLCQWLLRQS